MAMSAGTERSSPTTSTDGGAPAEREDPRGPDLEGWPDPPDPQGHRGGLAELDSEFEAMYLRIGQLSAPPEQVLKATVLMAMYSMGSERAFCERLNYDLLFKWFLDLPIDAKVCSTDHVHQEPLPAPRSRDRRLVLRRGGEPGEAPPLRVERSVNPGHWTGRRIRPRIAWPLELVEGCPRGSTAASPKWKIDVRECSLQSPVGTLARRRARCSERGIAIGELQRPRSRT
jgi:hypothetical protein